MEYKKSAIQNSTTSSILVEKITLAPRSCFAPDPRGETRIRAAIHLLSQPEGVTEFSINMAANCMSGRNYPTDFEREQEVTLIKRRVKNQLTGKSHTEYQIADRDSAERLAKYILHMQRRYHCHLIEPDDLAQLIDCYPMEQEMRNA